MILPPDPTSAERATVGLGASVGGRIGTLSGGEPGVIWVVALVVASVLWVAVTATIVCLLWRDWKGE
jgi:hypothetical protein